MDAFYRTSQTSFRGVSPTPTPLPLLLPSAHSRFLFHSSIKNTHTNHQSHGQMYSMFGTRNIPIIRCSIYYTPLSLVIFSPLYNTARTTPFTQNRPILQCSRAAILTDIQRQPPTRRAPRYNRYDLLTANEQTGLPFTWYSHSHCFAWTTSPPSPPTPCRPACCYWGGHFPSPW